MVLYQLAERLGKSVAEIRELTLDELDGWVVYSQMVADEQG